MADSLKITIIGPAYPLRGGGIATFNERLATQFQNEGHEVNIETFSLQYPGFLFPGSTQYSTEAAPAHLKIRVGINSVNLFNWLKMGKLIAQAKPDIVVVRYWLPFMGPCLGTILRIVKKNKHSKIVCIADNIIPHEKRFGDKWFTKYFVNPVDAFITMSAKVMSDLKIFAPKTPAALVAHPLYDNFGAAVKKTEARDFLKIDENLKILLFFGFIRKYKGLDLLYQAIAILKERNELDNVKLLVAGEYYEDRKGYEDLIAELDIADKVILRTDFITDSEVKYYLCAADVVIQPYKNATQSGVTPLAYHFETPMIVTNVGGLPDMVPHGKVGLVVEPSAEAIANGITDFFKLDNNTVTLHLKQEKEKYSWQKFTEKILQLAQ